MQTDIFPSGFSTKFFDVQGDSRPFVSFKVHDSGAHATIYLHSVEQADDLIAAALEARTKLTQHAPRAVA